MTPNIRPKNNPISNITKPHQNKLHLLPELNLLARSTNCLFFSSRSFSCAFRTKTFSLFSLDSRSLICFSSAISSALLLRTGQADFLEGKDVMDLLRGSKESWARLDVAQEAFSTICTKREEETERPCRLTRSRTGQPAAASSRSRRAPARG